MTRGGGRPFAGMLGSRVFGAGIGSTCGKRIGLGRRRSVGWIECEGGEAAVAAVVV